MGMGRGGKKRRGKPAAHHCLSVKACRCILPFLWSLLTSTHNAKCAILVNSALLHQLIYLAPLFTKSRFLANLLLQFICVTIRLLAVNFIQTSIGLQGATGAFSELTDWERALNKMHSCRTQQAAVWCRTVSLYNCYFYANETGRRTAGSKNGLSSWKQDEWPP